MKLSDGLSASPGFGDVVVYSGIAFFLTCTLTILGTGAMVAVGWDAFIPYLWTIPAAVLMIVVYLSSRLRFELGSEVVTVRGFLSTRLIPTLEIRSVSATLFFPVLQLETSEDRVRVFVIRQTMFETEEQQRIRAFFLGRGIEVNIDRLSKWNRKGFGKGN